MRTTATILALSFLVATVIGTSSSSVASSSSKSSSLSNSTSYSYSSNYTYTSECTPGAGGDAPCIIDNANYCCYYSWYQYTGESMVTSYECAENPSKESIISSAENLVTSGYSDLTGSSGYTSGGYCANSLFVRVSMAVASLGLASLFF
jgi:hypothetical protein